MTIHDPQLPPAGQTNTLQQSIATATASTLPRDTTGFRSSGQSPGQSLGQCTADAATAGSPQPLTLHLVGVGQVGRCFLRQLAGLPVRLVACSDRTATIYDRTGLPAAAIAAHKANGAALASWPRAERIPTELAIGVVQADITVDATPSAPADTAAAVSRGAAALRAGSRLLLCGKNAVAAASHEWLLGSGRGRVGIAAVLGGTGQQLLRELDELRASCRSVALVGNVTTTAIVSLLEQGHDLAAGLAAARAAGLLETDPTLDLDGSDAATKLAIVAGAVFGDCWRRPPLLADIARQDLRALDPELLQQRAAAGKTTRLVARAARDGELRVAYEELPLGSPLAAPADRVVYTYELPAGLRLHNGLGVGYERTAAALLADLQAVLAEVRS
jgi:homoserine dehydrogenase